MNFKNSFETALLAGALLLLLAPAAKADRRAYGETYEAVTANKGELDVESWTTYANGEEVPNGPDGRGVRQMVELEYGLTDRWDVALYNMLDVTTGDEGATRYAGLKVETRYRLALPGEFAFDPVVYLEYQYRHVGDADHSLEAKFIGAKDIGPWNFAANLALEVEHLRVAGLNPEVEFAVGVARELGSPRFKLGFEAFGKFEQGEEANGSRPLESFVWVGPAVSCAVAHVGPMRGVWVTLAAGHGITDESQTFYGRAVVGLQF